MDDDQMMAMDEQLTQVFQSRMSSSGRKSAQDQDLQREATHFKNRVLDLVDLFVRNEPTSPLLLSFILPLVDLATQCSSDERQLADKAKGILRNRICKSKEIPSDIDVSTPLQKVHQLARHARDSETLALLSETSVFLVKTSKNPKLCAGEYQTSIEDFATRKNSSLNPAFFQIYIKRFPEQAWQLRTNVMPLVSQSVNGYRASQTLQLVLFLLQTIDSPDISELTLLLSDVESAVSILISRSAEDEVHLTTQQAKELLKACSSVARKYSKTGGWKPVTWIQLAETFRKSSQFEKSPVLPEICLRLAKSLETPESEGKPAVKRKLEKADSASRKRKKA
ncbi:hypothetical protein DL96DRAFT_1070412 [Flagelloscypha sp. PMI_526]|nr:hypothetical protein DL96DRAFT_1070412 [Flagelloscypha sp. PMI_526]